MSLDFSKLSKNYLQERSIKKNYPREYQQILEFTKSLDVNFAKKLWHYRNVTLMPPVCSTCGGDLSHKKTYVEYCSKTCAVNNLDVKERMKKSRTATSIKKYGTDHPMKTIESRNKLSKSKKSFSVDKKREIRNKTEITNLKKYGTKNPTQNKEIQEKRIASFKKNIKQWQESYKNTSLERYGNVHPWSNKIIREKYEASMLKLYGSDNPMKSEEIKEKIKKTNIEKYGGASPLSSSLIRSKAFTHFRLETSFTDPKVIQKIKETKHSRYLEKLKNTIKGFISLDDDTFKIYCLKCDTEYETSRSVYFKRIKYKVETCTKCNKVYSKSEKQKELYDWLISTGLTDIKINDRKILNGKELDFFIPEKNIAIEFNGLYWHSEIYKDKWYHLNKSDLCNVLGIRLIHIYEDDWDMKKEIVKSRLINLLGASTVKIYARKCEVREITSSLIESFLLTNHIQGSVRSKYNIGLFHEGELVSVMSLGSLRASLGHSPSKSCYELLRFCSKLNSNVVGGASKLFSYFLRQYDPMSVLSYADRSWSTGGLYQSLGFEQIDTGAPNYWYIVNGVRMHRYGFRKDVLVRQGFDASKTESQIMIERDILRIYDSGSLKFGWDKRYIEKDEIS